MQVLKLFDLIRFIFIYTGIYVFEKERPVDTLSRLLLACGGNVENESVQNFFGKFLSVDQAISIALTLASRPDFGNVAFWAANATFRYAGEPTAGSTGEFVPSHLHIGLYRHVARLLSGVWKFPIQQMTISYDSFIEQLRRLYSFIQTNSSFIFRTKATQLDALKYEIASLTHLQKLISRTIELVMFLSICRDYNLNLGQLVEPGVDLELLASSSIRGPALIREIGSALVKQQLHLQASVESLCAVLLDRSPTFFSASDVQEYEGTDALERALKHPSRTIKDQLLLESLHCFQKAAPQMSMDALGQVLEKYRVAQYYIGILSLGSPFPALHERVLASLVDLVDNNSDREVTNALSVALNSPHQTFRTSFYDWLFKQSISGSVLLSTDRIDKSLLDYLEAGSFEKINDNGWLLRSRARADIYWKYLTKHEQLNEAGQVLLRLASSITSDQLTLPLSDRIQCLSMAVATLKSCQNIARETAMEAEELLEVALVQLELYNAALSMEDVCFRLNCRLYDLTTLFVEFAEPLGLSDIALLIVHIAGHADPVLVSRLWQRLLTEGDFEDIPRRFKSAASKLYPSDIAFPLPYLVDMLALIACKAIDGEADRETRMARWFIDLWSCVPYEQVSSQVQSLLKSSTQSYWSTPEHKRFLRLLLSNYKV